VRGGKRQGAGRPKGAATKRTREIAERAAEEGITPLEVMLNAMRRHYENGEFDQAAAVAKDAAPYMHPRLASVEQKVEGATTNYVVMGIPEAESDEEWLSEHAPTTE
jgi:hypothetical protein